MDETERRTDMHQHECGRILLRSRGRTGCPVLAAQQTSCRGIWSAGFAGILSTDVLIDGARSHQATLTVETGPGFDIDSRNGLSEQSSESEQDCVELHCRCIGRLYCIDGLRENINRGKRQGESTQRHFIVKLETQKADMTRSLINISALGRRCGA